MYNVGGGTGIAAGGALAFTGSNHIGPSLVIAVALIVLGSALVLFSNRRQRREAREVGI